MIEEKTLTTQNEMSPDLVNMYENDLDVGTEDAGESLKFPHIKINTSMSKNELVSGKRQTSGYLYHSELKTEYPTIDCHICFIGKYQLPDFTNPSELKMNYIIGGVKEDDNTPFVAFVKGYSLQSMWDFMADMASTKARYKVPLYAMKITLATEERSHPKFKTVDVWKFKINRTADGLPVVETDPNRAHSLKDLIPKFKEAIEMLAKRGYKDDDMNTMNANDPTVPVEEAKKIEPEPAMDVTNAEDVSNDIPF